LIPQTDRKMYMRTEPPTEPIPAVEGRNAPCALFAVAIGAQIMTVCFSFGLLYWINPTICLITIFVMTTFIYHRCWVMGIKSENGIWKFGIAAVMIVNIIFSLYVYYNVN